MMIRHALRRGRGIALAATLLLLGSPAARATTFYYADFVGGGSLVPFGTIDAAGHRTPIGPGLNLGADSNRAIRMLEAPDGEIYGFDIMNFRNQSWGRIDPGTGTFTRVGSLSSFTPAFETGGPGLLTLSFDAAGHLHASGETGFGAQSVFVDMDRTTGAMTSLVAGAPDSVAVTPGGARFYYTDFVGGQSRVPFGTINAQGNRTPIGAGLDLGTDSNRDVRLLFAPDGTLYGFDLTNFENQSWGRIDPATGVFTRLGSLSGFTSAIDSGGPGMLNLYFDPSGVLYASGEGGRFGGQYVFGTLDLTTGAFTSLVSGASDSILAWSAPRTSGSAVPEPATAGICALVAASLIARRPRSR